MKFWQSLAFTEWDQLVDVAKIADEVGFEGVLLSNHLFVPEKFGHAYPYSETGDPGFDPGTDWPDPWTTIGALAAATTRLRFATMVFILPLAHPLEVAKSVGTAAVLSGDRVALGAGAGWMREEFDVLGVDFATRGRRFDESIDVLRKVWTGNTVEHHGEFFDFPRLRMLPAPGRVPIHIGGISKRALHRAGRLGDGWIGSGQTPDELLPILDQLDRERADAGRSGEPFEIIAPLTVPPEPDVLERLEDRGVSGTVSYPFTYTFGPQSTLEQKRAYLEGFASNVIAAARG
jgi:probable F420-dependent oxidoreductase